MFHIGGWRGRLRDYLRQAGQGPVTAPEDDVDATNDAELRKGAGVSLRDAATRSDQAIADLIEQWATLGDRPLKYYRANTTAEALVRISYFHPRNHLAEHFIEQGDRPRATQILEDSAAELRLIDAPPHTLGQALYNLATLRVADDRRDEALRLLEEAFAMRDDLQSMAEADPDLAGLKGDARFLALLVATWE